MSEKQKQEIWEDRTASRDELCQRYGKSISSKVYDHYNSGRGLGDDAQTGTLCRLLDAIWAVSRPMVGQWYYADELLDERGPRSVSINHIVLT